MQRDRMLLMVAIIGILLAAAVGALVEPMLAAVPLLATAAAIVYLRRRGADDEWYEDDEEADDEGEWEVRSADDDYEVDDYEGPSGTLSPWQAEGGLTTWQAPAASEPYVDENALEDAFSADSWDADGAYVTDAPQEYEPLPTWGTFVAGEVHEDVESSDDILAASQQSALAVTEDLSEAEVQRVNQELLSRVHSLLAKYD